MALTLEIAVRTLFGTEFTNEAKPVGKAVTRLMRYQIRRMRSPIKIPPHWPTRSNRRADRDYNYLDSLVYKIIETRRQALADGHAPQSDLLSLLMAATDEQGGRMNTKQLRDEVMTLFIAGHETTAVTLGWTWHLLSQNPARRTKAPRRTRLRPPRCRAFHRPDSPAPLSRRRPSRSSPPLSRRLHHSAHFQRARLSRRLSVPARLHISDVPMDSPSRSSLLRQSPKNFAPSAGSMASPTASLPTPTFPSAAAPENASAKPSP